jgi:hypothetical protein
MRIEHLLVLPFFGWMFEILLLELGAASFGNEATVIPVGFAFILVNIARAFLARGGFDFGIQKWR